MEYSGIAAWQWPGNSYGPGMYSWFHIMWLVICVGLCILFGIIAKKPHDKKKDDIVIGSIAGLLLITEIIKQIMYNCEYYKYFRLDIVPLSFCSIPLFFAIIGSLVRNLKVKEICYKFLAFYGIIGGITFLSYPTSLNTYFVFISFQTMIWHSSLVIMGVYLLIARGYGKSFKKEVLPAFYVFLGLCLLTTVINEVVYFTILKPCEKPIVKVEREYSTGAYYNYGFDDNGEYYYLSYNESLNTLEVTQDPSDCGYFLIRHVYDIDETQPENQNYVISFGFEDFISLVKENGEIKINISKNNPTTEWQFNSSYYVDWTTLSTQIDGEQYFFAMDKLTHTFSVLLSSNYTEEQYLRSDFIKVEIKREGDSANYFFISNHYKTPIPVLDKIQDSTPYPTYVVVYILGFFILSCLPWTFAYFINKKETIL